MSTSHGNTVDTVVRTVFEFLNNSTKTWGKSDAKTLYEEITKNEPFKNGIPNYDKSLSIDFLKQLIEFHNIAQSKRWTIVPDGIKAFGTLNVFNETGKVGALPTAGTLDLLLYDEDGKFFIVDIKTMHKTSSMNAFKEEREEGWTIQINDYQYLLQQQYPEMEFTG
jgi:ATP-dependent exoDNAse (exonuclease V) beta subunit